MERFETALNQLVPKNTLLSHFLGKVLLYNISTIIQNAGALPDEKKAAELRTFLTTTTDLKRGESANEVSLSFFQDKTTAFGSTPKAV